ncbi:hypothetical protein P4233_19985 [Pseudomonas aeruginosa]|nr:hypothetical protein [Pseudomonas aeruginosa]
MLAADAIAARPWSRRPRRRRSSCPATSMRSRPAGCTTNCSSRNFGAAIHKFGAIGGGAFNFIDQNISAARSPSPCTTTSRTTPA